MVLFSGSGEMGERILAFDWSKTSLGSIAGWPQSLKTAVRILLNSRYPMFVWWGPELINIYNDAYMPILGARHPQALGQSAPHIWGDIWPVVGPQSEIVIHQGKATWNESILLMMERYGYTAETYFTFSYSPAPDDVGGVGGLFCVCTEDTQRVIGERQLALLRDLATKTTDARTWQEACRRSADALASNLQDLPFAMIYIVEPNGTDLFLAGVNGIESGHPAAPITLSLADKTSWPIAEMLGGANIFVLEDVQITELPGGVWEEPPRQVALVPIAATGKSGRGGVLIVGLNPFRRFDDSYGNFLNLVGGQIAASIASAQAYEEEKKRAEVLAELDQAKMAFFSNVSHEFRTPLTLMLGPVEDMLENSGHELTPVAKEQLEVVHRNSLRLLKLVNTMLDFSRIEAGRLQASYEPTNLAQYTAELASVFRAAIEQAGLQLIVNCAPLLEPVYVDRDMWEKIMLNLLSNAFKFTLTGEIEVRLEAIDERAQLTVRDTGVGIPIDEISHIFERFHRVKDARGRTHEGTGIGLALVQELVALHGGTVRAESVLNEGSQFIVTLPLGYGHLDPQYMGVTSDLTPTKTGAEAFVQESLRWLPEAEPDYEYTWIRDEHELTDAQITRRHNEAEDSLPRILWADDNADMREYVSRLLGERFEVEAVVDGQAALEAARATPPDLILSDVMMPRLDGFGLLQAVREDPELQDTPVILLSARAGEEARIEGLNANADDYLIKPFSGRELLARVESHVRMARIRREATQTIRQSETRYRGLSVRLEALLESTTHLIETLETTELLSSLLDLSHEIVTADALGMWRMDVQGNWNIVASNGLSDSFIHESISRTVNVDPPTEPVVVQPEELSDQSTSILRYRWERYEREGIRSLLILPLSIHGKVSGTLVFYCRSPYRFTEVDVEAASALANIAAAAITTAELYETQSYLRRQAEEAAVRESFLATAGVILTESLDYEQTLANVARVAVPDFADWCTVDLLDSEGSLHRLEVAHTDPQKIRVARELAQKYPPNANPERGVFHVIRTGEPELVREIPDELINDAARDDDHLRILRTLQLASYICVPLKTGDSIYGALTFVAAESKQPFEERDLITAQEIARRAAQAIENARLYQNLREGEAALRESEARFRTFADTAPAMLWITEPDTTCTFLSRGWYEYTGQIEEEALGNGWLKALHPDDRQKYDRFFQAKSAKREPFTSEYRLCQAKGGYRWVIDTGRPRFGSEGEFLGYIGSVIDVDERKQAEAALKAKEAELTLVAETIPLALTRCSRDLRYLFANRAAAAFLGLTPEQMIGKPIIDIMSEKGFAVIKPYIDQVLQGEPVEYEANIPYSATEARWVRVNYMPDYDGQDNVVGWVASIIDITERKQDEEALQANAARDAFRASLADALRSVADPLALQAEAARVLGEHLKVTRAFYAEAELDGEHVLIHRDYYRGVPSAAGRYRIDDFGIVVTKAFRAGSTLVVNDIADNPTLTEAERAAFAAMAVRAHVTACLFKNGRLVALLGVRQDMPRTWTVEEVALIEEVADRTWAAVERASAEASLRQLTSTLEDRVEERTQQVSDLARRLTMAEQEERRRISQILHDDLQQLVYAVKMKVDMLHEDLHMVEHLKLAQDSDEIGAWIDQIVIMTRQLTVDLSPPILENEGLANAIEWLQNQMKELHGIEVAITTEHDWYIKDEDLRVLLFQIVRELLFNVKKHAGVTQAKVILAEEAGYLVIHVIDEGKGFGVEEIEAQEEHAVGFGLFSVRERLRLLGGHLKVLSGPNTGTHVEVHTPVQASRVISIK